MRHPLQLLQTTIFKKHLNNLNAVQINVEMRVGHWCRQYEDRINMQLFDIEKLTKNCDIFQVAHTTDIEEKICLCLRKKKGLNNNQ